MATVPRTLAVKAVTKRLKLEINEYRATAYEDSKEKLSSLMKLFTNEHSTIAEGVCDS